MSASSDMPERTGTPVSATAASMSRRSARSASRCVRPLMADK